MKVAFRLESALNLQKYKHLIMRLPIDSSIAHLPDTNKPEVLCEHYSATCVTRCVYPLRLVADITTDIAQQEATYNHSGNFSHYPIVILVNRN